MSARLPTARGAAQHRRRIDVAHRKPQGNIVRRRFVIMMWMLSGLGIENTKSHGAAILRL